MIGWDWETSGVTAWIIAVNLGYGLIPTHTHTHTHTHTKNIYNNEDLIHFTLMISSFNQLSKEKSKQPNFPQASSSTK